MRVSLRVPFHLENVALPWDQDLQVRALLRAPPCRGLDGRHSGLHLMHAPLTSAHRQQFSLESFPFDEHDLLINVRSRASEGKANTRPVSERGLQQSPSLEPLQPQSPALATRRCRLTDCVSRPSGPVVPQRILPIESTSPRGEELSV